MLIEPSEEAFARAYDAGQPGVVWTRLVADLETPVSAMLKLSAGRANCFLLELVEGGAVRGRYSIIGFAPDLIFRVRRRQGRDRPRPVGRGALRAAHGAPARRAPHASSPSPALTLPPGLPPMAAGIFGYLGYDMVRRDGVARPAQPRPARLPRCDPDPADRRRRLRRRPRRDHGGDPRPPRGFGHRGAGLRSRGRAPDRRGRRPRHHPRQIGPVHRGQLRPGGHLQHPARALSRHGRPGEGLHRRRRYLPGRALPALRGAVRAAALRALPGAPPGQPLALPLLSRLRRLRPRRLQPRDPGAGQGRRGHHPPDRRHPAARRHAGGGSRAGGRAPRRPQGARRAPDAPRPRPERRRPRRRDRHGQGHRLRSSRNTTATSCTSCRT